MKNSVPLNTHKRLHQREAVKQDVLVNLGPYLIWRTYTTNVSKGGIALRCPKGLTIPIGTMVNVNLQGAPSDKVFSAEHDNGYAMQVVHTSGRSAGLKFT